MPQVTYRIYRAFALPLVLDAVLLLALLGGAFLAGGTLTEKVALAFMTLLAAVAAFEALTRTVDVSPQGLSIRKFRKTRRLNWADITAVGSLTHGRRAYLLLTTTKGFHILSNAYEAFPQLAAAIAGGVDRGKIEVEAGVDAIQTSAVAKRFDWVAPWLAAAVLAGLLFWKYYR